MNFSINISGIILIFYAVFQLPIWNRVVAWATTVPPKPVVDITKSVRARAGGLALGISFCSFFFRGVIFLESAYEKQYGLIFKDGHLTLDTVYEYKFSYDELKYPIVNIVTQSGWQYREVLL